MISPHGGTELQVKNLNKYVDNWPSDVNLIISICNESLIDNIKTNYLWQHLYIDQPNVIGMSNKNFTQNIDKFIYISEFQKQEFQLRFPVDGDKIAVLRNAITPIEHIDKPTDRIRLIYTSMPNRGLDVLLDVLEYLKLKDVEVLIYSSNVIYGSNYAKIADNSIIERCKASKYVTYKGYAVNNAIRKEVQKSHILAYPSTFIETSCIAAIEAGAAGCRIVTTNLGALPETCGDYARYCEYTDNKSKLIKDYAEVLLNEIETYDPSHSLSISTRFNKIYSWEERKLEWQKLLEK